MWGECPLLLSPWGSFELCTRASLPLALRHLCDPPSLPHIHTYTHASSGPLTQKLVAGLNRIIASRSESSSLEGTGENHDARISLQHHPAMSNLDAWFHGLASDQPLRDLLLRSVRLGAPKRAGRRLISIPNPMPLCVAAVLQDASRVHSAASEGRRSHPTRSRLH